MSVECPRCQQSNSTDKDNCTQCFLPLNPHHLSTFASNLQLQNRRIKEKEDEILLYENARMRILPEEVVSPELTRRIVYYKNHRFVLLDFFNVIWKKKAIIHFKLRPDKGLILCYLRKHPWSHLFLDFLEYLAVTLDWELKDITPVFGEHINLEAQIK